MEGHRYHHDGLATLLFAFIFVDLPVYIRCCCGLGFFYSGCRDMVPGRAVNNS
jgi:hypothetical protein